MELRVQNFRTFTVDGVGAGREGAWSGGAKVSCILRHWGVQLILVYSWARLGILVADISRGECFYFLSLLSFLFLFLPCSSFSYLLLSLLSVFSLSLGD